MTKRLGVLMKAIRRFLEKYICCQGVIFCRPLPGCLIKKDVCKHNCIKRYKWLYTSILEVNIFWYSEKSFVPLQYYETFKTFYDYEDRQLFTGQGIRFSSV